jgi:4-diphosphocytidyl-2-C-methyl-D-erythritol kinase
MIRATQQAHAKLNLLLGVTPEVVAGKHLLTTVFTTIDLADTLHFTLDDSRPRTVTVELTSTPGIGPLDLSPGQNIVCTAVEMMEKMCGRFLDGRLHVTIEKRIPPQGGLGGGSTDAAATLHFLAELWEFPPTDPRVLRVAEALGADVAFFCYGGCALMGGHGERLIRKLPQPALDLVLVKPAAGVSTVEAYRLFDADPQPPPSAEPLVRLLETSGMSGDPAFPRRIAATLANNLYSAACILMPELEELVAEVKGQPNVHAALLTGSGSTVFGICENARAAAQSAEHFAQRGYWSRACTTVR